MTGVAKILLIAKMRSLRYTTPLSEHISSGPGCLKAESSGLDGKSLVTTG